MDRLRPHIAGLILLQMCLFKLPGAKAMTSFHLSVSLGVFFAMAVWVMSIDLFAGLFILTALVSHIVIGGNPFEVGYFQIVAMWFLFVATWVRDSEKVTPYICALGVIHALLMLTQVLVGDPIMIDNRTGGALRVPCGFTGNINEAAAVAAICSVAMFKGRLRYLLVFPVVAIVGAKSFIGVFVLGLAGISFLMFDGRRKAALITTGVSLLTGAAYWLFVDSPAIGPRVAIIKAAFSKYGWDIFKGIGPGKFEVVTSAGYERFAHNELVQYTTELGIIIPALFAGWAVSSARSGSPLARAAIVASIAASMAYHVMHIPVIAVIIATWAAIRINHGSNSNHSDHTP